jgi:hypothetical protein
MARLVTVIFQRKRQQLETTAALRRLDAAQARAAAAQRDLAALQQAAGANVQDLGQIAGILDELLTAIGRLGELVVRNVSLAARTLDILLFSNATVTTAPPAGAPAVPAATPLADRLALDFGLIHPDIVADALLELRRGGVGAANSLLQRLTTSTAWLARGDTQTISSLQQTGRVGFLVSLADLPAAACELRVKGVGGAGRRDRLRVGAVGGRPADPRRLCAGATARWRRAAGRRAGADPPDHGLPGGRLQLGARRLCRGLRRRRRARVLRPQPGDPLGAGPQRAALAGARPQRVVGRAARHRARPLPPRSRRRCRCSRT